MQPPESNPPAASEDTRVRDDVPKLRRAGFVRAFRDSLRQASPPRPEQLGDEARVGATLAVAHPESSTASFPSHEAASHALVAFRADPNEAIGKPAWATARPAGAIASPPRPELLGDKARVGATLAVAHPATLSRPEGARSPIPNPARLRFLRTKWPPRASSGNALAMDAQRLRLFTDAENVLSCTSIFRQGRGTG